MLVMRRAEILKMATVVVETVNQCKILLCCVKMNLINKLGQMEKKQLTNKPSDVTVFETRRMKFGSSRALNFK